jgi:hypothetical protein
MRIACLGWGSLKWDTGDLPVRGEWFEDGPMLPIEFARHSSRNRITLVLVPEAPIVQSLWIRLFPNDLATAKAALAAREGIETRIDERIGHWSASSRSAGCSVDAIAQWGETKDLDAVVWTALPPKFDGQDGRVPTAGELVTFLRNLPAQSRIDAEEYVRRTPRQINTPYRRLLEIEFGWTQID